MEEKEKNSMSEQSEYLLEVRNLKKYFQVKKAFREETRST